MFRTRAGFCAAFLCASVIGCASNRAPTARTLPSHEIVATTPGALAPASPTPIPGVDNFGVISKDIWRGGRPNPAGMQTLKSMGVKTIIDLEDRDGSSEIPAGIKYVRLSVSAFRCDTVDRDALLKAIAENPKPIFIHCRQGRDRTGLAVAIYRCETQRMRPADAIKELHNFNVNFWWAKPIEARILALRPTENVALAR